MSSFVIAIDGPAAAGKGTLARRIAEHYGFAYLDTGLIYRATGKKVLDQGADPTDASAAEAAAGSLGSDDLSAPGLRTEAIAEAASKVAVQPPVRAALLTFQRRFAESPPGGARGAVLDGRDIGTVVCPQADVKFFITASPEVRAKRRFEELQAAGDIVIYARVLEDVRARDARDRERSVSPLTGAADAIEIDTSDLTADQVFAEARKVVDRVLG